MSEQTYELILLIIEVIIAVIVFVTAFYLLNKDLKGGAKRFYDDMKERNRREVRGNPEKLSAYDSMLEKMIAQGITYRMGDHFSPFDYACFRIAIALGIGLIGLIIKPVYGIVGLLFGVFIVPYYFKHEDEYDNGEMLSDICQIYGIIEVQVKNSIHLSKAIYECYLGVQQPRLKKALMELSTDIEKFSSVEDAAVRFRKKFNNKHIDTFAKTLEQAESTGSSLQLFEDVSQNLRSINKAIAIQEKQKQELRSFFFQTLIFGAVFIFVIFMMILMMGDIYSML